jgi:hypothetical protein
MDETEEHLGEVRRMVVPVMGECIVAEARF